VQGRGALRPIPDLGRVHGEEIAGIPAQAALRGRRPRGSTLLFFFLVRKTSARHARVLSGPTPLPAVRTRSSADIPGPGRPSANLSLLTHGIANTGNAWGRASHTHFSPTEPTSPASVKLGTGWSARRSWKDKASGGGGGGGGGVRGPTIERRGTAGPRDLRGLGRTSSSAGRIKKLGSGGIPAGGKFQARLSSISHEGTPGAPARSGARGYAPSPCGTTFLDSNAFGQRGFPGCTAPASGPATSSMIEGLELAASVARARYYPRLACQLKFYREFSDGAPGRAAIFALLSPTVRARPPRPRSDFMHALRIIADDLDGACDGRGRPRFLALGRAGQLSWSIRRRGTPRNPVALMNARNTQRPDMLAHPAGGRAGPG